MELSTLSRFLWLSVLLSVLILRGRVSGLASPWAGPGEASLLPCAPSLRRPASCPPPPRDNRCYCWSTARKLLPPLAHEVPRDRSHAQVSRFPLLSSLQKLQHKRSVQGSKEGVADATHVTPRISQGCPKRAFFSSWCWLPWQQATNRPQLPEDQLAALLHPATSAGMWPTRESAGKLYPPMSCMESPQA